MTMTGAAGSLRILLPLLGSMAIAVPLAAQCEGPIDLGRGPVSLLVPAGYDDGVPAPLVVLLHGYGASGELVESYFRLARLADELGFLYAHPDGTVDASGNRFWNATDACCDTFGTRIDDAGYLGELIGAIRARCRVDPRRIHVLGHSNGGFMSYRMACDQAGTVAGIASLAGATYNDPAACAPAEPVHVLQIHGTLDGAILYRGGTIQGVAYPGAAESVALWAQYDGCSPVAQTAATRRNLSVINPGRETVVSFHPGCSAGGSAELWAARGAGHVPLLTPSFGRQVLDHLLARPKCRGRERVRKTLCKGTGRLTVKLSGGVPGEGYRIELPTGEVAEGTLASNGRARVRFTGQKGESGRLTVAWGCGAASTARYSCR